MKEGLRFRSVVWFITKFILLAPPCLILWWWLLFRPYVWTLGQVSGLVLRHVGRLDITAMRVVTEEDSVLNTATKLLYIEGEVQKTIEVAHLVNSLPPFIILILATAGLGLFRRLKIMGIGLAIFFLGQCVFIILAFRFVRQIEAAPQVPTALGQFWLTLPFVLWIVLAYWDKLSGLFTEDAGPKGGS